MKTKKDYILDKIDFIRELQSNEEYEFIQDCYNGMIDDLEILILNIEDDSEPLPFEEVTPRYPEGDNHIDMSGATDNGDR